MKSKYETHVLPHLDKIAEWAEKGASQTEIADNLHIAHSTFKLYLAKGDNGEAPYSDLSACFRRACEVPDDNVEAALYKKAMGYNATVVKHYKVKKVEYDEKGKKISETEELVPAYDEVHVPADTTAQMFWLANRRGDRWRYKPEPVKDSEDDETGVVVLPDVMAKPNTPDTEGGGMGG